ncbi:transcriptional regulator [Halobacillus litoralis]|uniref:Transcriptional regulator n=1 Tax=Halobacillus litoralis TaxID=45668 RepID=A0A410MBI7_9BACI|nr:transcriptional regulator [Halobacillus litoralis]
MLSEDNHKNDMVFNALADPIRRQLLDQIALTGEATATTLAKKVPVSRQAVVKHLTVLNDAGLVFSTRIGREMRHRVCPGQLFSTAEWMRNIATEWDRKLDWIKDKAEMKDNKNDH